MKKRFVAFLLTFVLSLGLIAVMGENVQISAESQQDGGNKSESSDVETIDKIKDASDDAINGASGANGEILITTAAPGGSQNDIEKQDTAVTKETTSVTRKGTTVKVTVTEYPDGSKSEITEKTSKSGNKVVTVTLNTAPDGTTVKLKETVIIDEEGNTIISSKVVDKDAEGKTVQTVIYESLTYPEENGIVNTVSKMVIKNGKGKVQSTVERAEIIVTAEDGNILINERSVTIFKSGKTELVISMAETDPEGIIIYSASETITESKDGKTKIIVEACDEDKKVYKVGLSVNSKGIVSITSIDTPETEESIPESVLMDGVDIEITAIAKGAMKGNEILESIEIGENITKIGKQSFYGDKKLKNIWLTASVKEIGKDAFKDIAEDAVFTIEAESEEDFNRVKNLIIKSGVSDTVTIERE